MTEPFFDVQSMNIGGRLFYWRKMITRTDIEREINRIEGEKIPPTGYDPAEKKYYWICKTPKGPIVIAKSFNPDVRLMNIMRRIKNLDGPGIIKTSGRQI